MTAPLIILDRDGVINQDSAEFVKDADEWIALPGSLAAIARLTQAGWRTVVATNQSGLARRKFSYADLSAMHRKCQHQLNALGGRIDGWFFCPHGPSDDCLCRKPRHGLYSQIERAVGHSVEGVPSVGDSMRDLAAARTASAKPILVRTGNGSDTESQLLPEWGVPVYADLASVAEALLR
ncbi:MAG: D-glycero-beta-D-manno-heptose 1,7-bisphosphate 7-phosphatase [Gammaproteobacteria bacterium]